MPIVKDGIANTSPVAAFDVGSNSIKMTVARSDGADGLDEFLWRSATVRLGAGIETSGRLADDRIEAALEVLNSFATEARDAGAQHLIGVATEAVRIAANGAEFLNRVRQEIGLDLEVISGEREAELTFRGLKATLDFHGDVVVADIGGGSTEVINAPNGTFLWGRSIPLGSGRLTDNYVHTDPPTMEEIATCREAIGRQLNELEIPAGPIGRLVVAGGTGEYLVKLVRTGMPATIEDVDEVLNRLTTIRAADLVNTLEISENRARVLPAGIAVVRELAERTRARAIEGARSGLRTAILLDEFARST